ncbi:hypothetical protein KM759_gp016 [Lymphocystis disease virus 4]|uniref:Uncharacterized protein n=1 Tax=Lymphocystis disease virus 4 TaxID=2704413 RepID=A0A6B9XLA7_9VIRU|nr:hypothetical protein KM759_gp016 [Lymphocystis disease virus 4]QHR78524.1 hypothetical protein [Lymphocystis disease virus 4]
MKCVFCQNGRWYQCPDCVLYWSLNNKIVCYNQYKKLVYTFLIQARKYRPHDYHIEIRRSVGILRTLIGPIKIFKKYKYDPVPFKKFNFVKFLKALYRLKTVTECYVYANVIDIYQDDLLKLLWRETYTCMVKLNKRTDNYDVITQDLVDKNSHIKSMNYPLLECSNDL